MSKLHVERIGGLAAFGTAHSRVRSHGEIEIAALSPTDQQAVEGLFQSQSKGKEKSSQARDAFRYRITRKTPQGVETIEAPEEAVPEALSQCVKDELV